ncbi:ligase-associated DNA damage response endonuclease PdeM [Telmatocola sphagniphila]|uniref:Ligase-associated DNA damage response endonuclease PdeM n=1 Tax=Telmatocola sphagniphila TaxID=1123043 RepID=A0A8E6B9D1_9BACT|nr:ligase-associated DNA damage response endonuclease PdeM [Telmatocola sphagniphila]QVL33782.1 ligase-associated DNA damage response endonuclease PdeM [Telmatocola sphagniphila]
MKSQFLNTNCPITWGGQELWLLPERAVYWPAEKALLVADIHFGKEASFRASQIPIPDGTGRELQRLSQLIRTLECQELIILGDLLHSRRGRSAHWIDQISQWRYQWNSLKWTLIKGNHDQGAGELPSEWKISELEAPALRAGLLLRHIPLEQETEFALAGHLHPKVKLRHGPDQLRLPCFLERGKTLILPAFGTFVDHGLIELQESDKAYLVAGEEVVGLA